MQFAAFVTCCLSQSCSNPQTSRNHWKLMSRRACGIFWRAHSDASGQIYRQECNMNRKWLWLPGCRAFILLLLCNSPTCACNNFYFILLYLGFCADFRIVSRRSLAAGGSLIICPQKSRLSCSSSLIAASTSIDVITAFAVFLRATDWTEEEKPELCLRQIRCSACILGNFQTISKSQCGASNSPILIFHWLHLFSLSLTVEFLQPSHRWTSAAMAPASLCV